MKPEWVILHCSASRYALPKTIDTWHQEKDFLRADPRAVSSYLRHIGYQWVICNGRGTSSREYNPELDGKVVQGRFEDEEGAHCRGMNSRSLGICMVGEAGVFTDAQLAALDVLCCNILVTYNLTVDHIIGHYEAPSQLETAPHARKTCPGLDMVRWRTQFARTFNAFISNPLCSPKES